MSHLNCPTGLQIWFKADTLCCQLKIAKICQNDRSSEVVLIDKSSVFLPIDFFG